MGNMLKITASIIGFILVSAIFLGFYAWREIGKSPSKEELKAFEKLPYFKGGRFYGPEEMKLYPNKVRNGPAGFSECFFNPDLRRKKLCLTPN